jgi:hypothetical protein
MERYSYLNITEREDITVCWRGHEEVSRIAARSGGISQRSPGRLRETAGTARRGAARLQGLDRAVEGEYQEVRLQAAQGARRPHAALPGGLPHLRQALVLRAGGGQAAYGAAERGGE